ncbi:MAG: hypothetical protein M1837_005634 [Sclerophora amabilis]|nr:MAG: hypothetical protein M1837_005634 [Sclerophora amabilis]
MIGKRKRRAPQTAGEIRPAIDSTANGGQQDPSAVFRQHFEAQFEPLENQQRTQKEVEEVEDWSSADEETDWSGLSDQNEEKIIEVVDHTKSARLEKDELSKQASKAFMTAKPPSEPSRESKTTRRTETSDAEDVADAANLKKDLALQRLLQESHLLDPHSSLSPSGTNRHKALDLRLQTLGSKTSIFKQEKMPMSHRKGITAKAVEREERRRKEAKENGIVLERPKNEKRSSERRERGIGGPAVGKFRGGMLKLSKEDVADIQGSRGKVGSFKGGKRRIR